MAVSIRQIHPVFVGEVNGVDLRRPLSRDEVRAIEAGMNDAPTAEQVQAA
jgi:alpha-ketoglutarate-dependent 2,4-dichlorophenoxyacetate dioxygenase